MIFKTVQESILILAAALVAAGLTWAVIGKPDRSVPCLAEEMEEGSVCFEELKDKLDGITWVDARSRAEWERNGIKGSILLTDHNDENWDDLFGAAVEQLFEAPYVVVYCNEAGCGSSKAVAGKLRELGIVEQVDVLYGGWKALRAAGAISR